MSVKSAFISKLREEILPPYEGFLLQSGFEGREIIAIINYANYLKIPYRFSNKLRKIGKYIPVGSVEFVESFTGPFIPEYYPGFLHPYLNRKIKHSDRLPIGMYVKPADRYKRFDMCYYSKCKHPGPYWGSEVVKFGNEFRYYVADGEVLCGWWYQGPEDIGEAPELDIRFPPHFCGAVDFGYIGDKLSLIENHAPYAIGWYGEDFKHYGEFIIKGWKSLHK